MTLKQSAKLDFNNKVRNLLIVNLAIVRALCGKGAGVVDAKTVEFNMLRTMPATTKGGKSKQVFVKQPDTKLLVALLKWEGYEAEFTGNVVYFARAKFAA